MGSKGGGAGARGGGGAQPGAELPRTIPFSELEARVRIDPKSREQLREGWALLDDEARQYVLNSGITNLVQQRYKKGARTQQQGGALFNGQALVVGRQRFLQNMEPTGEVRIRPTAGGMTPLRTASTLVHEAGHVGGKHDPTTSLVSLRGAVLAKRGDPTENTATNVQLNFLGRLYQESVRSGNTGRGMEALFVANQAYHYRVESSRSRAYGFSGSRISTENLAQRFGDMNAATIIKTDPRALARATEQKLREMGL